MGNCLSGPKEKTSPTAANGTRQKYRPSSKPTFGLEGLYETIQLLGRGGEGETWLCKDVSTQDLVAVKLIRRPIPAVVQKIVEREIQIQADLGKGHINLVGAHEVVLTHSHLGLVMEYVDGGNMVSYVSTKRDHRDIRTGLCLSEDEARYFFRQIVGAVEFCHKKQVIHRDLKLDNTLVNSMDPPRVKLCDFGFAKAFDSANSCNTNTLRIGTLEYMPPELISSRDGYDGKKVDAWACGVLLFVMLFGKFPFEGNDNEYDQNTTQGMYDIWRQQLNKTWRELPGNIGDAEKISSDCRDLMDKMFDIRQETRISTQMIKEHPWYVKPLLPRHQKAFDEMQAEQGKLESQAASGYFRSSDREKALEVLIKKATVLGSKTDQPVRLKLSGPLATQIPDVLANGAPLLPSVKEADEDVTLRSSIANS